MVGMSQPSPTPPAEDFSRSCPVCLGPIDRCTHLIELRDALAAQQATAAERRDAAPVASPAPSLGCIVIFTDMHGDPHPAIVSYVVDRCCDLHVLYNDERLVPVAVHRAVYEGPGRGQWTWPPRA